MDDIDFPLTPIQHWFFDQDFQDVNHFNQSAALITSALVSSELLTQAISHVLMQHATLRTQFYWTESGWRQNVLTLDEISMKDIYQEHYISFINQQALYRAIEKIATEMHSGLNVEKGLIFKVANIKSSDKQFLIFVVHHLAIDGMSWQIFLNDLAFAYAKLANGEPVKFAATVSYQQWTHSLMNYVKSKNLDYLYDFWLKYENLSKSVLPMDFNRGVNTIDKSATITVELDELLTKYLLENTLPELGISIDQLLSVTLAVTICNWTKQSSVYFSLENPGRNNIIPGIDISQTMGWFTVIYPAILKLPPVNDLIQQVIAMQEQLHDIVKYSFYYGVLRYLMGNNQQSMRLSQMPNPPIIMDYFVNLDDFYEKKNKLGELIFIPLGMPVNPDNKRLYLLEIGNYVVDGKFKSEWTFSLNHYYPKTIQQLADQFLYHLQKIIDYSRHKISSELCSL